MVEIYITTGEYDIFVKIYAKTNVDLMSLIHGKFQGLGLSRSETLIVFKEVMKRQIPISDLEA